METSSSTLHAVRGTRALRRWLEQAVDLRGLDLEGFRRWLGEQLSRWELDPAFAQRARIRDLRQAHPELLALERTLRQAIAADEASPQAERLFQLEEELSRADKAIAGLGAALERTTDAQKLSGSRHKLAAFQSRRQALLGEQALLLQASPARRELLRVQAELEQLRSRLGLERAEAELAGLSRDQGHRSGHAGQSFEQQVLPLTWRFIVPELLRRGGDAARLRVLRGVGLGAARTEFDQLIIRQPRRPGQPVEVLGMVEVKRNFNDLAHGFRHRQENLAWFKGEAGHYDSSLYRTRYFRSGHFDREAVHEEDGERFIFSRDSFRHFRRESGIGLFLRRLYFITRGGILSGVSTAALARIRHRVATDARWRQRGDASLGELLRWCQSLAEPLEAPDVLRLYGSIPARARQVLVIEPRSMSSNSREVV
ncbi:hypothetical protein D187_010227 [Cystobacter fuscus DSM 2262]|uniref:Uncharacterized protein n=1 Tax=Cystobacter fuscus (strain ATCC 25194 / DSM 2262 / NBRC 100088 / M29) TaxID=1242864 RepID=S9QY92_CYSF2|nr:hypothetical protein [Cystobacter fuscus]EPX61608.1 hypothetical protein D187_010227 [Cystobacter fuscus DSM 2262]